MPTRDIHIITNSELKISSSPTRVEIAAGDVVRIVNEGGELVQVGVFPPNGTDLIVILLNGEVVIMEGFYAHSKNPPSLVMPGKGNQGASWPTVVYLDTKNDPISNDNEVTSMEGLSRREREVLQWVAAGKTNLEISILLSIALRTVEKHCENIYKKLGVENRISAVREWMDFARYYQQVVGITSQKETLVVADS